MKASLPTETPTQQYAEVNGIKMYYEIHGNGFPLVLIHGGGSTINTNFCKVLPALAANHMVIAVELQAHGHTSDREAPESFEQDADDVAELLSQLEVQSADVFGFSNGGNTAMQLAIRHSELPRKLILASSFYTRQGMDAAFWTGMDKASFADMPQVYKDEYLKINNDPAALLNMFKKDRQRMQTFKDWPEGYLRSITAPTLVVVGDQDVIRPEHAVEMYRLFPKGQLAIIPGTHGSYMGEAMSQNQTSRVPDLFVAMIDEFLLAP
ncbi:MAG: alpha/beta hydrolase [Pedobacter sp.]|jgi:pimeloyl-ACP methyl ester carboxylesterase|nr:alpha/beta hydrolase [Pedobacter sp.]